MSVTVREFFGHKDKPGHVGMELEVESLRAIPAFKSDTWLVKEDHSLRNIGSEFYTRNPVLANSKLYERIQELTTFLSNKDFKVDHDSTRTSFHVHVNVLDHTMIQYWTMVFAYWLLEKPLMRICGASRCGNQFCLRASDAEGMLFRVEKMLSTASLSPSEFNTDDLRYASQNLKATAQFGSLEYRGMRGTHDAHLLNAWTLGLYMFSQNVKRFKDPKELFDFFDKSSRETFVTTLLSGELASLVLKDRDLQQSMSDSFDSMFSLIYETDWNKLASRYEAAKTPARSDDLFSDFSDETPVPAPRSRRSTVNTIGLGMAGSSTLSTEQIMTWVNSTVPRGR